MTPVTPGRRRRIRKDLWFFFFSVVLIGLFVPSSYGEEEGGLKWGFSLGVGQPHKSEHSLNLWTFFPRVDVPVAKNWDVEFEGNAAYYDISRTKNLYVLGLNTNVLFEPLRWEGGELFLLGGAGLGYNNNGDGEADDMGDSHVAGILQCGSGVLYRIGRRLWLRGEYRFYHLSDPFHKDGGINTHNVLLGVSF